MSHSEPLVSVPELIEKINEISNRNSRVVEPTESVTESVTEPVTEPATEPVTEPEDQIVPAPEITAELEDEHSDSEQLPELSPEVRALYQQMVNYLKLKIQKPMTPVKITMLIAQSIRFLARISHLTETEKKNLALHAIRDAVKETSHLSDSDREDIFIVIDTLGETSMDILIQFAKDTVTFFRNTCGICRRKPANKHTRALELHDTVDSPEFIILLEYLKLRFQKPYTPEKMLEILAEGVRYIEYYNNISGTEKKDLVIKVCHRLIVDLNLPEAEQQTLSAVLDTHADVTIEWLVRFGKSKKKFRSKKEN